MAASLEPSYYLPREDDHKDHVRTRWSIVDCLFPEDCSWKAWKRADVTSYVSEDACKEKLHHHLSTSCLHAGLDQADIPDLVLTSVVMQTKERFAEREAYRRQVENQHAATSASAKSSNTAKGKGVGRDHEPSRSDDRRRDDRRDARHDNRGGDRGGPRRSRTRSPCTSVAVRPPVAEQTIAIPISKIKILKDSLGRTQFALNQVCNVCNSAASQLRQEENIVREAKTLIEHILS